MPLRVLFSALGKSGLVHSTLGTIGLSLRATGSFVSSAAGPTRVRPKDKVTSDESRSLFKT